MRTAAAKRRAGLPRRVVYAASAGRRTISDLIPGIAKRVDQEERAMKVTKITGYGVHPGLRMYLVFVKVVSDAGIHGWGEAYSQYDRDKAVLAHVSALGYYLDGR
jgi:hypothetical protein